LRLKPRQAGLRRPSLLRRQRELVHWNAGNNPTCVLRLQGRLKPTPRRSYETVQKVGGAMGPPGL
jgi:hypothetical protein